MTKYQRNGLTADEMRGIASLIEFIEGMDMGGEGFIDHVQIRNLASDNPKNIAGKIGYDDSGTLVYTARKEKK